MTGVSGSPMTSGALLAICLRVSGWLAVTLLCALGCLAAGAIAIGSFTLFGTMLQLDNLASRFVAAEPVRQAQFGHVLLIAFAFIFLIVSVLRRASLVAAIFSEEGL